MRTFAVMDEIHVWKGHKHEWVEVSHPIFVNLYQWRCAVCGRQGYETRKGRIRAYPHHNP